MTDFLCTCLIQNRRPGLQTVLRAKIVYGTTRLKDLQRLMTNRTTGLLQIVSLTLQTDKLILFFRQRGLAVNTDRIHHFLRGIKKEDT